MIHNSILIFTDGASKGNPGPGGFGAIVALPNAVTELGGRVEHTTNNRMELTAAIEVLAFLQNQGSTLDREKGRTLILYSDSSYVINGMTKWVHGWKKNGWKTTVKKDVENRDLWEKLSELAAGFDIEWQQVAGHADTPGNTRCDEIASAFAEGTTPMLFRGPRDKYGINLSRIGIRTNGKRGQVYSYVSLLDGVTEKHTTWKDCETRVKGKKNARYKKVFSKEEEKKLIQEFSKKYQK